MEGLPEKSVWDSNKSILGKAFLILECVSAMHRCATLSDITGKTGLPKSTVYRVAASLVELGALERHSDGYRLGLRLFELGSVVPRRRALRDVALPFMEDLFSATRETVHLGILDGAHVVYLEKIYGHRNATVLSQVGGRLPAHCTGIGKVLLAFAPPSKIDEVLAGPLVARTPYTIVVSHVLRKEIAEIAKNGIGFDREEASLGLQCVAAPVFIHQTAVAALSVSAPTTRFDAHLAPAVQTAALGLSRALSSPAA
jgi:DNA-binding IclR family transcriptional regulator